MSEPPRESDPIGLRCASCGIPLCGCPDAQYAGIVIIDDRSEPGSWAQHIRDTECMRPAISPIDSNRRHEADSRA